MSSETVVALVSYNIGINTGEITDKAWATPGGKLQKLLSDVKSIFNHGKGIQIALISEMGNMFEKLSNPIVEEIFKGIIENLKMPKYSSKSKCAICCIDRHALVAGQRMQAHW